MRKIDDETLRKFGAPASYRVLRWIKGSDGYAILVKTDEAGWFYVLEMSGEAAWWPPNAMGEVFRLVGPAN